MWCGGGGEGRRGRGGRVSLKLKTILYYMNWSYRMDGSKGKEEMISPVG